MHPDELEYEEAPGGDYNRLPYPSMPFAYTQPSHLAALASLFGFEAPAADRARVLELGCASGGNIIPLAARFPDAVFVGFDLSQRHVDDARKRINLLGLKNIEVRQGDLATISVAGCQFDYVICHGVFSWVPKNAQEAILRICGESLAPNGLATISYNVLPGWRLRGVIRDICLHHAGTVAAPRARVSRARQILEHIAKSVSDTDPYGLLLRNEAKRCARLPASYILGEFLAANNEPFHFQEFVGRAAGHGLGYLCEGDLAASLSETLFPETESRITAMAEPRRISFEQYKDFFSGRPFRRSVLIRTDHADGVLRKPNPDNVRNLHFSCKLHIDPAQSSEKVSVYKDARDRAITTSDPAVRRALARLEVSFPATRTLEQLTGHSTSGRDTNADGERICDAHFRLLVTGQASMSTLALDVGRADTERPRVWPLALVEAASRQPWVTSLRHDAVPLQPDIRGLLTFLDGNHDRQMLIEHSVEALHRGEIRLSQARAGAGSELIHRAASEYVDRSLQFLATNALLEPA